MASGGIAGPAEGRTTMEWPGRLPMRGKGDMLRVLATCDVHGPAARMRDVQGIVRGSDEEVLVWMVSDMGWDASSRCSMARGLQTKPNRRGSSSA